MASLMDAARTKGLKIMEGEVLTSNHSMLKLVATLGFTMPPARQTLPSRRSPKCCNKQSNRY